MKLVLTRFALLAAVTLASPFAAGQAAEAKGPRTAPLAESLSGSAKDAYESARVLLNNRDWPGAFNKFQEAYEVSKDPRLLFNMAVCARDMKAYARTQQLLLRYEHEAGSSLSAEEISTVDAALATIRTLVGSVKVEVNEDGAALALDGVPAGITPLSAPLVVDMGKHALTVTKPGFDTVNRSIDVAGGGQMVLALTLVARPRAARLTIVAEPGTTVTIDKRPAGADGFDGTLAPGTHEIQVSAPAKKPYTSLIELRDGEARTLQLTLVAEPHPAPLWPWIAGGAVLAAGAVVGGYFLLRPRDERAAGPTGSLGSVALTVRSSSR